MNANVSDILFQPLLALSVGWFDPIFIMVLAFGFWRGRHNGASDEWFHVLKWFMICVTAAMVSGPVGGLMAKWAGRSQYASTVLGYFIGGGFAFIAFACMEGFGVDKMVEPDFFGKAQPHAGAGLGVIKFMLILMIPLALIYGRRFGDKPTSFHGRMKAGIFDNSLSGALVAKAGGWLMFKPVSNSKPSKGRSIGAKKNRQMNEASK